MGKALNVIAKGVKTLPHVAVGCLVYGAVTAATNFHPANPMVSFLWDTFGVGAFAGISASVQRWAGWDPTKVRQ